MHHRNLTYEYCSMNFTTRTVESYIVRLIHHRNLIKSYFVRLMHHRNMTYQVCSTIFSTGRIRIIHSRVSGAASPNIIFSDLTASPKFDYSFRSISCSIAKYHNFRFDSIADYHIIRFGKIVSSTFVITVCSVIYIML